MVSMMVPAEGSAAMLQKTTMRSTVTLVGQPEKAAEHPVRALRKLVNDADKQLTNKTSTVKVHLTRLDSAAPDPLQGAGAKDELANNEDAEEKPGVTKNVKEQSGKIGDAKEQPTKFDEEEVMKKHLMAKIDVVKGQPSEIDNAAQSSEVDNAVDAAVAEDAINQSADTDYSQEMEGMTTDANGQSATTENSGEETTSIAKERLGKLADAITENSEEEPTSIDKKRIGKPADVNEQLSNKIVTSEDARQNGTAKQISKATNDEKGQPAKDAEESFTENVDDAKDKPSRMDNEGQLSKRRSIAEDADAMVYDTEDAGTEKVDTTNTGTAKTEIKVAKEGYTREEAEIAAPKGQESETGVGKDKLAANEDAPETNEVNAETNNALASGDAESERDDEKTTGDAVAEDGEETEEAENTRQTIDATMHEKYIEIQADKKVTNKTAPTSVDASASQEREHHWKQVRGPGDTLSLDNAGFDALTKLKDTKQASVYIQRVLRKQGFVVSNETGLLKYASLCSNAHGPRSFDLLSKYIFKVVTQPDGWAGILRKDFPEASDPAFEALAKPSTGAGLTSPLNQEGYLAVLELRSSTEMSVFIHRVINHLSLDVNDKWGLMGVLPFYDGEKMEQNFATLTTEILGTALQPGNWVSVSAEKQ